MAIGRRLRYNGLVAVLGGSGLSSSGTAITFTAALTHSGGTAVPTITGSDYIPLALIDGNGVLAEIVHLTAYTAGATTGTVARGKGGTTGVTQAAGVRIQNAPTVRDVPNIEIVASTSDYGTDASSALTVPAGVERGDLLLVFNSRYTKAMTGIPSGWTTLVNSATSYVDSAVVVKTADGTESGTTVTFTWAGTTTHTVHLLVIRGAVISDWGRDNSTITVTALTLGAGGGPMLSATPPWRGGDALIQFVATYGAGTGYLTLPTEATSIINRADGDSATRSWIIPGPLAIATPAWALSTAAYISVGAVMLRASAAA